MDKVLVTGCAGFIGYHLCKRLLRLGNQIVGVDNINDYYDVELKKKRLENLNHNNFKFFKGDISEYAELEKVFEEDIDLVINLAAQAGVRYSLKHPFEYEKNNNLGFLNVLELSKKYDVGKIVFASSSSVYGNNKKIPFSEDDRVDKPISLYAATKKYNEMIAHAYHDLYGIKMIGLRFFTVYGELGRPDMAYFKFAKLIMNNEEIEVYNHGDLKRDFTYVSDIIDGIVSAMNKDFGYEIFNLGNSNPVELGYFIELLEENLGKKAKKKMLPMQLGDVKITYADLEKSKRMLGYEPKVSIEEGLRRFCKWFKQYYVE